jgi:hypothetical protein
MGSGEGKGGCMLCIHAFNSLNWDVEMFVVVCFDRM